MTAVTTDPTPYKDAVQLYIDAGWQGVLPIPARQKTHPPTGYTGANGRDPTVIDLDTWRQQRATGNIALRMPADIIGIDIDNYGNKPGGDTLTQLETKWGPLPDTWISTSRHDGISGIRFYRIPEPTRLVGALPGIEIIQRHHRYAVVAPSIHPEGRRYYWIDPDGQETDAAYTEDLPMLPPAWLEGLRADTKTSQQRHQLATGDTTETSLAVERALGQAVTRMTKGTRHDAALAAVTTLARLDERGHPGANDAINQLRNIFLNAVADDRQPRAAEAEWDRMLESALELVATTPASIGPWQEHPDPGELDDILGDSLREPEPQPWPDPTPLPGPPTAPNFPIHTLPDWTQQHVQAIAEQIQTPPDLPATITIGALSAAATGRARIHISPNWTEPSNLYLAVAMRSGAGKSGAEKLAAGWLRRWQQRRLEQAELANEVHEIALEAARYNIKKLRKAIEIDTDAIRRAVEERNRLQQETPPSPRLLADDATPEAVAGLMHRTGERLAILSTEGDLFDMLMKGRPGDRANLNLYLKAWSGDQIIRDRRGSSETGPEATILKNPLLTVSVTVQPTVIGRLYQDDEMVSRGFATRFMISAPQDLIGHRDQTKRFRADHIPTSHQYDTTATALADTWATWANPADLHLHPDAAQLIEQFLVDLEPHLAQDGHYAHLAEWSSKLAASIARYAGLLHLSEQHPTGAPIDADTMTRAIDLGHYWLAHAEHVMAVADDRLDNQIDAIMDWATSHGRFTIADLQKAVRRPGIGLDRAVDYVPAIEALEAHGWIRAVAPGDWRTDIGIRRAASPQFDVWPKSIGKTWKTDYPRKPRTAYRESANSLSPYTHSDPTRYADYADNKNSPNNPDPLDAQNAQNTQPVDNPAPSDPTPTPPTDTPDPAPTAPTDTPDPTTPDPAPTAPIDLDDLF